MNAASVLERAQNSISTGLPSAIRRRAIDSSGVTPMPPATR